MFTKRCIKHYKFWKKRRKEQARAGLDQTGLQKLLSVPRISYSRRLVARAVLIASPDLTGEKQAFNITDYIFIFFIYCDH